MSRTVARRRINKKSSNGYYWNAYKIGRLGIYIGGRDITSIIAVRIRGRRYVRVFWRVLWAVR